MTHSGQHAFPFPKKGLQVIAVKRDLQKVFRAIQCTRFFTSFEMDFKHEQNLKTTNNPTLLRLRFLVIKDLLRQFTLVKAARSFVSKVRDPELAWVSQLGTKLCFVLPNGVNLKHPRECGIWVIKHGPDRFANCGPPSAVPVRTSEFREVYPF